MPVRNERGTIGAALDAVLLQDYPTDRMEILVVDGESDDGTPGEVRRLADARGNVPRVEVLSNPRRIVPTAMNIAIAEASGEVIVRVDGHCIVQSDHVSLCVRALLETGAGCAGGTQAAFGTTPVERAIAQASSSRFGVPAPFRYAKTPGWTDTVYLGAYRTSVLRDLGGYDEDLVRDQDDELNHRLRQSGAKIWYDPAIRTPYHCRPSLRALGRQYFQYGMYKVRVLQKRGSLPALRAAVPPVFVAAIVGATALAAIGYPQAAIALAASYGLWLAAATASAARSERGVGLLLVPVAVATMHIAYGLGCWWGAVRWARYFFRRG